ncbi:MAG: hypothetical protein Q8P18_01950 [Pseudomonadota bacterium]|nr:hypothetical protein [Pseudomonadota bacterium]
MSRSGSSQPASRQRPRASARGRGAILALAAALALTALDAKGGPVEDQGAEARRLRAALSNDSESLCDGDNLIFIGDVVPDAVANVDRVIPIHTLVGTAPPNGFIFGTPADAGSISGEMVRGHTLLFVSVPSPKGQGAPRAAAVYDVSPSIARRLPPAAVLRAALTGACAAGLTAGRFGSFLQRLEIPRIDRRRGKAPSVSPDQCATDLQGEWEVLVPERNDADPYHKYCEVADSAVIGRVTERTSFESVKPGGGRALRTRAEVVTDTTVRGAPQQGWTVEFAGGEVDGVWSRPSHAANLVLGERYLLFLRSSPTGIATVVGGENGAWPLPEGTSIEDAAIAALVGALCG